MRLLLALLALSKIAVANPAPHQLEDKLAGVLLGRLGIRLPIGMKVVANPADLTGLMLPRTLSSRAVLEEDGGRFVMTAVDTLTFVDGSFKKAVEAELGGMTAKLREGDLDGTPAVFVDPVLPRGVDDSNLVHAVYLKAGDRHVIAVAFYVFGEPLRTYVESWARAARDSTATLRDSGSAPAFDIAGSMMVGERTLTVDVPDRWYVFGLAAGRLETVGLLVRERVALGIPSRSCTVDRSLSTAPGRVISNPVRWLGMPTRWRVWQTNSDHQAEIEVKFGDLRVRGWCTARTAQGLREAMRIVGEMRAH